MPCSRGAGYFGRNLDLDCNFGEQVVVTPRHFPLRFRRLPAMTEHYALIGMANLADGVPMYAEAANEKGVYMAGLNFPGNAWFPPEVSPRYDAVTPYELIPWLLGSCASLTEVRKKAGQLPPTGRLLPPGGCRWPRCTGTLPTAPARWCWKPPATGSLSTRTPVGVLTNNPPFPFHQMNLNQYQGLSARPVENRFAPDAPLTAFGQGMGAIGLPGDSSPASRYVKAAFHKLNTPDPGEDSGRVAQFFHLLDAVAMVRGSVITPEGKYDITTYACCFSAETGTYYYKTYDNNRLTAVRLAPRLAGRRRAAQLPAAHRPGCVFRELNRLARRQMPPGKFFHTPYSQGSTARISIITPLLKKDRNTSVKMASGASESTTVPRSARRGGSA